MNNVDAIYVYLINIHIKGYKVLVQKQYFINLSNKNFNVMKKFIYTKVTSGALVLLLPFMVSCSSLFGGGVSNDPAVAAQQQLVEARKAELKEAEQLEKAAKDRLKAAKHALKALKSQAKRRGY